MCMRTWKYMTLAAVGMSMAWGRWRGAAGVDVKQVQEVFTLRVPHGTECCRHMPMTPTPTQTAFHRVGESTLWSKLRYLSCRYSAPHGASVLQIAKDVQLV